MLPLPRTQSPRISSANNSLLVEHSVPKAADSGTADSYADGKIKVTRWIGWKLPQPAAVPALRPGQRSPHPCAPPGPGWRLRAPREARPAPGPRVPGGRRLPAARPRTYPSAAPGRRRRCPRGPPGARRPQGCCPASGAQHRARLSPGSAGQRRRGQPSAPRGSGGERHSHGGCTWRQPGWPGRARRPPRGRASPAAAWRGSAPAARPAAR